MLAAYFVLNAVLVYYHEPWRDEAHHWLLARDLSFFGLVSEMKYDGHLCLWNLILMPFAKIGLPYIALQLVSLGLMTLAAGLFLRKFELPLWLKALILFSPIFTYYYSAISRHYCMIPPMLFALAIVYPQRHKRVWLYSLLIAILMQTHILMLGMAFILTACWFFESLSDNESRQFGNLLRGLTLPAASLVFMVVQLWGVNGSTHFSTHFGSLLDMLQSLWLKLNDCVWNLFGFKITWLILLWCLGALLIVLITKEKGLGRPALIAAFSIFYQVAFYAFLFREHTRYLMTWPFIILFSCCICWKGLRSRLLRTYLIIGLLGMTACITYIHGRLIVQDIRMPYSDSKNLGTYLEQNFSEDDLIVCDPDDITMAAIPYLSSQQIWNPVIKSTYTFVKWDAERQEHITVDELLSRINESFPETDHFYLIRGRSGKIDGIEEYVQNSDLLYETSVVPIEAGEQYRVFRVDLDKE